MCECINNPTFAIRWAKAMRSEADKEDTMGRHSDADFFRAYAEEIERVMQHIITNKSWIK